MAEVSEGAIRSKAVEIVDLIHGYTYNAADGGFSSHLLDEYDYVEDVLTQWLIGRRD